MYIRKGVFAIKTKLKQTRNKNSLRKWLLFKKLKYLEPFNYHVIEFNNFPDKFILN